MVSNQFLDWRKEYSLFRLEIQPSILRRPAIVINQLLPKRILDLDKVGLVVRRRQTLGQLLESRAEPIIRLVPRRPEGVPARIPRSLDDLQDRVVGRDALKGDTTPPISAPSPGSGRRRGRTRHATPRWPTSCSWRRSGPGRTSGSARTR